MLFSLRCTFRVLLEHHSKRFLTKNVAACDITDFDLQGVACDTNHSPCLKRGQFTKEFVIDRITKWLHCSPIQAGNILAETPNLVRCHLNSVEDYIKFMNDMQMEKKLIIQNPWLLDYSLSTMRERITLLSKVGICQNTVRLLQLDTKNIRNVVTQWISDKRSGKHDQNVNRLEFFSKELQCTVEQLIVMMKKDCSLLVKDFDEVLAVYFLLLDHGFTRRVILRNLRLFNRPHALIKHRLETAILANAKITLKMLTLSDSKYAELVEKMEKEKLCRHIVNADVVDIFMERLECSYDYVASLTKSFPKLLRIDPTRVNQNLNILYEFGFTANEIRIRPRVLALPEKLLRDRLQEFEKLRYRPAYVKELLYTKAYFSLFIAQLRAKSCESDRDDDG